MTKNAEKRENGVFEPLDLRNPTRYRHPVSSIGWFPTRSMYWQSFIPIRFLDFAVTLDKNSDIETLTPRIFETGSWTTGRFEPDIGTLKPYRYSE